MTFVDYIKRGWDAAQLKTGSIRQLADDNEAVGPAIGILAIGGLCAGIGTLSPVAFLFLPFVWVIGGFILVAIMHFVATTFFEGKGRLTSFAVPVFCASVVTWVAIIPLLGPAFLAFLAGLWMLVVMVVGVEVIYGIDRGKAIAVVAIPVVLFLIITMMLALTGIGLLAALGTFRS
ncbi:MAG: YIP1 family protein [Candidatus Eisenbacteria sp.]|nr:YIP1 family protein [Candidatus Eisenbacteria bacterium]